MKILMTCQYYWPDNFLINEIAEDLVKKGHKVTVLTGLPDYTTTKVPKEYKWGKRRHETHNGVEIIRVPIIARHHGFIMRVINYMSYYINSSIYARFHKFKGYDIVYSYQLAPVFMINPGRIIKKKRKIPMFVYVLDLWPDQMKVWHVGEKNPIFKLVRRYCRKAYRSGDVVGITTKSFREYLVDVCKVYNNKIMYLPQHSEKLNIKETKKKDKKVNLIFAGNIGQQQNLECLIKAVSLMKTKKDFLVNVYGDGTSFEKCRNYAKELEVNDKVAFYGRVKKEKLNAIFSKMDAFCLTLCSEKEIGFVANTVPAKLQSYMSAGKPILASIDGDANKIIKEVKCGSAVASGDYEAYSKILDDFVEHPDKYKDCGKNAIKYFNNNFEKELIMKKIEETLENMIKKEK
jgi:glycosyltransferase involved in cell wall biosynthesis